jgi:hypothetical protein
VRYAGRRYLPLLLEELGNASASRPVCRPNAGFGGADMGGLMFMLTTLLAGGAVIYFGYH